MRFRSSQRSAIGAKSSDAPSGFGMGECARGTKERERGNSNEAMNKEGLHAEREKANAFIPFRKMVWRRRGSN